MEDNMNSYAEMVKELNQMENAIISLNQSGIDIPDSFNDSLHDAMDNALKVTAENMNDGISIQEMAQVIINELLG